MAFQPEWYGPHPTKDAGVSKATHVANWKQRAVSVFRDRNDEYVLEFDGEPKPRGATLIYTAQPDPKSAPKRLWPIVDISVTSDKALHEVEAENWRERSNLLALKAGIKSSLRPYHTSTTIKSIKLNGRKIELYALTVRKNPSFPHHRLASPTPDASAND